MKTYLINNQKFILIALVWLFVGIYLGPVVYVILPASLFLMYKKEMHVEILVGFFFILTMSDSRNSELEFAGQIKNIYLLFIALITFKEMKYQDNNIIFYKYFIAFFLTALISILFSPVIFLSFQKLLSYFLIVCCVPNYIVFIYQKYGIKIFKGIVFFVFLILALSLVFNSFSPDLTNLGGRFRGLLGNPNGLGLYVFLFILLFATLNEHFKDLFNKNEKIIIYVISFLCLIKCGARASLIATLMFFFFKRFYKISPIIGFIIFIITVFIYQLVSDNLVDIFTSLGLGEQFRVKTLETGSGRVIAWNFAWDQIQYNFYFGKGFSYTEFLFKKYYQFLSKLGHEGAAHNSYLTLWLDTGLVGLILYLVGLLITFLKAAKKSKLAIPLLYSVLFSNYYESWITASLNPFTIQLLIILTIMFVADIKLKADKDILQLQI